MNTAKTNEDLIQRIQQELSGCKDLDALQEIKTRYLGRKGIINEIFKKGIASISVEEKPDFGKRMNELKSTINSFIIQSENKLLQCDENDDDIDLTLPVETFKLPRQHPLMQVLDECINIFTSMGFGIAYGPEIENVYNNFTALNFPEDHPARDMHDTLYLKSENLLLRTHTSPVQIRIMNSYKPPYKFVAPGKCYRRDTIDASHSPVFYQLEGLMVDNSIKFSDLKGILGEFALKIFSENTKTRFRPSFFPFTEPSAEMDIMCAICSGKGCKTCSGSGWLEILGAGMVDPAVFSHCGVDTDLWQGFAFGMGIERIAMLKYEITDMRLFYQNDIRFLEQF